MLLPFHIGTRSEALKLRNWNLTWKQIPGLFQLQCVCSLNHPLYVQTEFFVARDCQTADDEWLRVLKPHLESFCCRAPASHLGLGIKRHCLIDCTENAVNYEALNLCTFFGYKLKNFLFLQHLSQVNFLYGSLKLNNINFGFFCYLLAFPVLVCDPATRHVAKSDCHVSITDTFPFIFFCCMKRTCHVTDFLWRNSNQHIY